MHALYCRLGLIDYRSAHELQTDLAEQRRHDRLDRDLFLITEHPAVFTLGRRGGRDHLLVSDDFLAARNIGLVHAERGGVITYHGPGQLVLYPIIDLRRARLTAGGYVACLEEVMLRLARDWGVTAERDSRNRGIWAGGRKLGSVGIAIRRGISFHGLALNVNPSLEPFTWINPCGLAGVEMTSIAMESGRDVPLPQVEEKLPVHLVEVFGREFREIDRAELS
jgi:lipoyl(octanoyl) transferase